MKPNSFLTSLMLALGLVSAWPQSAAADEPSLLTRPRESWLDPRVEPIALIRALFAYTDEEQRTEAIPGTAGGPGSTLSLDSSKAPRSIFGHRRGFILEDVEVGLRGRFNELGLYYQVKAEIVPREKDGNRSDDYLKDAYLGWDRYNFIDLRMGRMKVPFGLANQTDTRDRAFPYNPTFDVLIPKRQIGFLVSGGDPYGIVRASAGVFNTAAAANEEIRFLKQLMYTARLELRLHAILNTAGASVPWLKCTLGGSFGWTEESYDPQTEHRWVGGDLSLEAWRFKLRGEVAIKDFFAVDSVADGKDADRGLGWAIDLTGTLIKDLLDLSVRYEEMDGDDRELGFSSTLSIDEAALQSKAWISASLSVTPWRFARFSVTYIHRDEREGFDLDNDVFLVMSQLAL